MALPHRTSKRLSAIEVPIYVQLHPVFSSGHTCTHIALIHGEYNNICDRDTSYLGIFGHKERLSVNPNHLIKTNEKYTGSAQEDRQ
jgi:hypothetical protein